VAAKCRDNPNSLKDRVTTYDLAPEFVKFGVEVVIMGDHRNHFLFILLGLISIGLFTV